jgi:hypothetical protein
MRIDLLESRLAIHFHRNRPKARTNVCVFEYAFFTEIYILKSILVQFMRGLKSIFWFPLPKNENFVI